MEVKEIVAVNLFRHKMIVFLKDGSTVIKEGRKISPLDKGIAFLIMRAVELECLAQKSVEEALQVLLKFDNISDFFKNHDEVIKNGANEAVVMGLALTYALFAGNVEGNGEDLLMTSAMETKNEVKS